MCESFVNENLICAKFQFLELFCVKVLVSNKNVLLDQNLSSKEKIININFQECWNVSIGFDLK